MNPYDRPTVPNEDCEHKQTTHVHGTHACYVLDRCRCDDCRTANLAYEKHRRQWARQFPLVDPPYVDAGPARRHVQVLADSGMGPKRVAQVTGVSHGSISKLLYGDYATGRPPSKRIKRETARKLLACPLDVADGIKVDGTEARAIVAELVARGWTKVAIGKRVHGPQARSLQLRGGDVFASTVRTLRQLLEEPVPPRYSRWGTLITPPVYEWQHIPPTTPGVPAEGRVLSIVAAQAKRQLTCEVCGEPLVTHPITRRCA